MYDIVLLIGEEVESIWKARQPLFKTLYLLYRYGLAATTVIGVYGDSVDAFIFFVSSHFFSR